MDDNLTVVEKLHPLSTFSKERDEDLGFDLTAVSVTEYEEKPEIITVNLGIKLSPGEMPFFGWLLFARSSLPMKGWSVANGVGVIDPGYRGEWKLNLVRIGAWADSPASLVGQRVAQAIHTFNDYYQSDVQFGPVTDTTDRGEGGFGSTGA